jgi:WD40 repeat protein
MIKYSQWLMVAGVILVMTATGGAQPAITLQKTLGQQNAGIELLSLSSDGTTLITRDWDATIKVWNVLRDSLMQSLVEAKNTLVAANANQRVVLMSPMTAMKGSVVYSTLLPRTDRTFSMPARVVALALSQDARFFGVGLSDKSIHFYRVLTQKEVCAISLPGNITAIEFSPNGNVVACGLDDHSIVLIHLSRGVQVGTLRGHSSYIAACAFSSDGQQMVSADGANTLMQWDVVTQKNLARYMVRSSGNRFLQITPDGKYVLSPTHDGKIAVIDLMKRTTSILSTVHTAPVTSLATSSDGKIFVTGSADKTVKIWNTTGIGLSRQPLLALIRIIEPVLPEKTATSSWIDIETASDTVAISGVASSDLGIAQVTFNENNLSLVSLTDAELKQYGMKNGGVRFRSVVRTDSTRRSNLLEVCDQIGGVTSQRITVKKAVLAVDLNQTSPGGVGIPGTGAGAAAVGLHAAKDVIPPTIILQEPQAITQRGIGIAKADTMISTKESSITVKGLARDAEGVAVVRVNNIEANLTPVEGGVQFSSEALLTLGTNHIEIEAIDKYRNVARATVDVKREIHYVAEVKKLPENIFRGQYWAVVVGISEYKDMNIPTLRYAHRDAEDFYEILVTSREKGGCGIAKSNVLKLTNSEATTVNIRGAITDFLKNPIEDDVVLIYFAGHGVPDPTRPNVPYLLAYDSDISRPGATAVRMQEIQDAIKYYIKSNKVIVFADACHSAGIGGDIASRGLASSELINEFLADLSRTDPSICTFSAAEAKEKSQEGTQWGGGHGVFTYFLLDGMKGSADYDKDHIVRLGELLDYVNENVRRATKAQQHPFASGAYDRNLPMTMVP